MDKEIDIKFERLEKALSALVDSISKYNPSIAATNELVEAERNLSKGLEKVSKHQNNHLRLEQLRNAAATQDKLILETLQALATMRKELKSTPETKFPTNDAYPFSYSELLGYASRISKMTMPFIGASLQALGLDNDGSPLSAPHQEAGGSSSQSHQPQSQQPRPAVAGAGANTSTKADTSTPTTGGPTPAASTPLAAPAPAPAPTAPGDQAHTTSLPDYFHQKANPRLNGLFTPFPDLNKIRSGALATIQMLQDSGIDPKGYDPVREAERKAMEDEEKAAQDERERLEREEEGMRIRRERDEQIRAKARERREQEMRRKASVYIPSGGGGVTATIAAGPSAGASGAVSGPGPAQQKSKGKGEFQFIDDLDDED